ncbi:hypothetical protein [Flavobacterium sp. N1736]|nr:hypothetical protein [Flavobacterium sp. N1736]
MNGSTFKNSYAESSRTSYRKTDSKTTSARSNQKTHIDTRKSTLKK